LSDAFPVILFNLHYVTNAVKGEFRLRYWRCGPTLNTPHYRLSFTFVEKNKMALRISKVTLLAIVFVASSAGTIFAQTIRKPKCMSEQYSQAYRGDAVLSPERDYMKPSTSQPGDKGWVRVMVNGSQSKDVLSTQILRDTVPIDSRFDEPFLYISNVDVRKYRPNTMAEFYVEYAEIEPVFGRHWFRVIETPEENKSPPRFIREWTSKAGTRIKASFASSENGKVVLVNADWKRAEFSIEDFAAQDQRLIRKHLADQRARERYLKTIAAKK
jgi:hypothetical protein